MKITIIGSTLYKDKMIELKERLEKEGDIVKMPAFDFDNFDELGICINNRIIIEWADEIHIFWDQRSMGTVFDFGMVFMARKRLVIEYVEAKTLYGVMKKYALHYKAILGKE